MPLPFLIAGAAALAGATAVETAAVGVAAAVLTSDKKKAPEAKTSREQISASDVPDDVRRQIEGDLRIQNETDADILYQMGNEYYYGWNGRRVDHLKAKECFKKAKDAGHKGAKQQIYNLIFRY